MTVHDTGHSGHVISVVEVKKQMPRTSIYLAWYRSTLGSDPRPAYRVHLIVVICGLARM